MDNKQRKIAIIGTFIIGLMFFIVAIMKIPSELSFNMMKDVSSSLSAALIGVACMATSIIGAIYDGKT